MMILLLPTINNSMVMSEIKKYEPFSPNNVLLNEKQSFQIKEKLPKIEAASAFYPFAANLVQNIYDENKYSKEFFQMVSTNQAFEDITSGKADIIIATKPSEEQIKMIEKSNANLKFEILYLEPLAILVNGKNSIDNLTIEQIQKIYNENDYTWNTYQLEKNNGSQTCFEKIVKDNELGNNHYEINTMPKIIDKIAKDKKGIGYSFYSYCPKMHIKDNVKIINVEEKNIKDEDYPLLYEVYLIYKIDSKNENIPKIANWLKSQEGKEFINKIKDRN